MENQPKGGAAPKPPHECQLIFWKMSMMAVFWSGEAEKMSGIETDTHVSTDVLKPTVSEKMETDTHVSTDVLEKGGGG